MTADQLIPASVVDILTFADQYSTPENVEYFLRWDVSDIFYNYFFIGNCSEKSFLTRTHDKENLTIIVFIYTTFSIILDYTVLNSSKSLYQ